MEQKLLTLAAAFAHVGSVGKILAADIGSADVPNDIRLSGKLADPYPDATSDVKVRNPTQAFALAMGHG